MTLREQTLPHRLLAAAGWLYARLGRERCDVCGGPLPSGEYREVTRTAELDGREYELQITLCRSCENAYWAQTTPESDLDTDWHDRLMRRLLIGDEREGES